MVKRRQRGAAPHVVGSKPAHVDGFGVAACSVLARPGMLLSLGDKHPMHRSSCFTACPSQPGPVLLVCWTSQTKYVSHLQVGQASADCRALRCCASPLPEPTHLEGQCRLQGTEVLRLPNLITLDQSAQACSTPYPRSHLVGQCRLQGTEALWHVAVV